MTQLAINTPPLKFGENRAFEEELHSRVDAYFAATGLPRTALPRTYIKALTVISIFFTAYGLLVFAAHTFWWAILYAAILGLATVGIGVNLQHDGSHNAYSKHRFVNRFMAFGADLIGASSYLWHWKHIRYHHPYTNIVGHDTDIDLGLLARIAPSVRLMWYHRWQHLYIWFFYAFFVVKWHFFDDFYNTSRGILANRTIPRPKGADLAIFIFGKIVFLSLAFGIPLFFHSVGVVLFFYIFTTIVAGLTLSLIFILPHAVGESEFPLPDSTGRILYPRAEHQARVTVDFVRYNPVVSWLVGGLNFHREHHLFPLISHAHYKKIAPIVDEVCDKFNIPHAEHRSYTAGLVAHYHWLRKMGRPPSISVAE